MEIFGLELVYVAVPALSGIAGVLLTYLTTRRQSDINEKTLYLEAVEKLTAGLWDEIDRVNSSRSLLQEENAALEVQIDAYDASERELERRIAELEARERRLLACLEQREEKSEVRSRGSLRSP